jgi:DnaJ-class molecular chaperone
MAMILEKRCPYCHGQGTVPDPVGVIASRKACPVCTGRGHNLVPRDAQLCSYCRGGGHAPLGGKEDKPCPDCGGIGSVW